MPLIPLIAGLLLIAVMILSMPILLVLRYRTGTMRRKARLGPTVLNLISLLVSTALFIWFAALTNFWVPHAFSYSLLGFLAGFVLALLGLAVTRWEKMPPALHYTPNRWLVLLITLGVVARLVYGIWRAWHSWHHEGDTSWLASAGVAGSMAVGAVVLGYYLAYNAGVCWQLRKMR